MPPPDAAGYGQGVTSRAVLTGIVVACLTLAGCAGSGEDQAGAALPASSARLSPEATEPEGQGDLPPQEPPAPVGPTSDFVTVTEPAFGSFTVSVPADWDNLVYATVDGQIHRTLVTSVSPDGQTVIFIGDPSIPSYWEPAMADDITRQFAEWLDSMELPSATEASGRPRSAASPARATRTTTSR